MTSFKFRRIAAVTLALVGVAACSDNPASPSGVANSDADVLRAINAPAAGPVKAPLAAINASVEGSSPADTLLVTFQVGPQGGVFALGRHWISFPPNSVCNMNNTSYGEAYWNDPCPIADDLITVNAKVYVDSVGRPHVDFAEHLRFDPTQQVILHLTFDYREGDATPDILWRRDSTSTAVDEGELDPAMVTLEGDTWMVYRRVKHFSGYTVSAGFLEEEITLEASLRGGPQIPVPGSLNSGHVVATGRNGQIIKDDQ